MKSTLATVVLLLSIALLYHEVQLASGHGHVKVAAFNVKNLGMTRLNRAWLVEVIVQVGSICTQSITIICSKIGPGP